MGSVRVQLQPAGDVVRLVQLTDTHLCANAGGTLLGVDTDASLNAVIDLVRSERPHVDAILATGDLSDQGAQSAYQRLQTAFDTLCPTQYWLPGNHDNREAMLAVAGPDALPAAVSAPHWQVIMLDSQIPGEVGGELGPEQLAQLSSLLDAAREAGQYVLVCLHHQPVPVGCAWLDEQMVADADTLFAFLDTHDSVRGVLWGHVHQHIQRERNGVELMASPSTCVQFAPDQVDFRADVIPPGYRWLDLHPDGRIETGVSRLPKGNFIADTEMGGYL